MLGMRLALRALDGAWAVNDDSRWTRRVGLIAAQKDEDRSLMEAVAAGIAHEVRMPRRSVEEMSDDL